MKFGSRFFAVVAFGATVLLCAAAYAGVCFITGDCGSTSNFIASRLCSADYGGQYTSCSETGFKLGGKSCFYNGTEKYERCECSTSYFKYDDFSDADKYVYYDWANMSNNNANYCEEKRAHAKKCKSVYQFAASTDISKSWTNSHYAVSACPTNKELDVTAGTCTEIENLKEGGSPYTRYKSCRCKSGIDWKNCDKPHQVATSSAITCDDLVSECTCESGYEIADDGTCEEIKPDIPDGSEKCGRRGARYVNAELVDKQTCDVEGVKDPKWALYYPANKRIEEIRGLACEFMKLHPSEGLKIVAIPPEEMEDIDNAIYNIVGAGNKLYEIHMHPLFSSRFDEIEGGWGFDLGIGTWYLDLHLVDINFPLLVYGVLHDAGAYEMHCDREVDEEADNPKEYGYYGWLGNITKKEGEWTADNPIVTGDDNDDDGSLGEGYATVVDTDSKLKGDTALTMLYRPYVGGKGKSCNPSSFNPYREQGCTQDDCSILAKQNEDVWGFGGDKCLNHVFNLNAAELTMPFMIVDMEKKVSYYINSEPRFGVGYGSDFEWTPEIVFDEKKALGYFDYAGNFLPWKCSDKSCVMTCNDTKKEYTSVEGRAINTYPYMNGYWISEVWSEKASVVEGLDYLSEIDRDTNHNIVHTFIGGTAYDKGFDNEGQEEFPLLVDTDYVEAEYYSEHENNDWLWRKYFNNSMEKTINGIFPISNPWGPLRGKEEGGLGPLRTYGKD